MAPSPEGEWLLAPMGLCLEIDRLGQMGGGGAGGGQGEDAPRQGPSRRLAPGHMKPVGCGGIGGSDEVGAWARNRKGSHRVP